MEDIKIEILPNLYLKEDETFDLEKALQMSGKIAGLCYAKTSFHDILEEDKDKTLRRIENTLSNGHHSVYDHIWISFYIKNIPKILAMVLNNEKQYTTSEKSLRYTPIDDSLDVSVEEKKAYYKWLEIMKDKIGTKYGEVFSKTKIKTLAQENARSFISVFMPTQMVYSTTLRQINNLCSFMQNYYVISNKDDSFEGKLATSMVAMIKEFQKLNVLDDRLMGNDKNRNLSLFGSNLGDKKNYFGDLYEVTYDGTYAELAQAQRHRTLDYQMERKKDKSYFVPPIIETDPALATEWLTDMMKISNLNVTPIGEMITIRESGSYQNFILKCKERLCSNAQLEIMLQTRKTLLEYMDALKESNPVLYEDIKKYSHGARCSFPDYVCPADCKFKEGKTLVRKI